MDPARESPALAETPAANIAGPRRFSLRELFLATLLCAVPLAFQRIIGLPAAASLVAMACSLVIGRGGLAVLLLCVGLALSATPMGDPWAKWSTTGQASSVEMGNRFLRVIISTFLGLTIASAPWFLARLRREWLRQTEQSS